MAVRPDGPTRHRRQDRRQRLTLELLEQRQVMAASVAVGAGIGSRPIVTLLDAQTGAVRAEAMAFETTFKGGVRVAMGDIDGDNSPEILAASGAGRVAEIRVFKEQVGSRTLKQLVAYRTFPFGSAYWGGTDVACGDVDANGREDIVAAMSRGGGGVTEVYAGALGTVTAAPLRRFAAFASLAKPNAPVSTAPVDLDGDGAIDRSFVTQGDASRNPGIVSTSALGSGTVIKGMDEGVAGMKVNGRRIITVPTNLAHGDNPPADSTIPKGATLTFEVELVAVHS